jgi:hypothetical protein
MQSLVLGMGKGYLQVQRPSTSLLIGMHLEIMFEAITLGSLESLSSICLRPLPEQTKFITWYACSSFSLPPLTYIDANPQ